MKSMILLVVLFVVAFTQGSFESEHRKLREQRNEELRAEDGWLTVAGLFWLKEGSGKNKSGRGQAERAPAYCRETRTHHANRMVAEFVAAI